MEFYEESESNNQFKWLRLARALQFFIDIRGIKGRHLLSIALGKNMNKEW